MTHETKRFWLDLLKYVSGVILAAIIMGFIMRPSQNRDVISETRAQQKVDAEKITNIQSTVQKHDDRIERLELLIPEIATKTDLDNLKNDLIRELK